MRDATRIVFNTVILYAQLFVGLIISLFTTRIVLNALGEIDFGIYMLITGVVVMLSVLNTDMASTSMRFMATSIGTRDKNKIIRTFNTTLFLHLIIGVIVIIVLEVGGWFMFEYILNIPEGKIYAAKVIFQFMVVTTYITIISVPYDAVMNAHENMLVLSIVETLGNILKLGAAIYLTFSHGNLLIIYGFLILIIQICLRAIKQLYSKGKYAECKILFREYVDKKLIKEILSFTGWNLFGSIGSIAVTRVRSLLINMFFGVKLNAAEGISNTATSQINMFSVSMTRALNPQLMKSEGSGNRERLLYLTEIGTKFSSFLFALFAIPVLLEAKYILDLWLKSVPEYAVIFTQLVLVTLMIEKFTFQITHAIRAVGDVKTFQVTETLIRVISVPLAYYAVKSGYGPNSIYLIGIAFSCIVFLNRLFFGKEIVGINIWRYFMNGILSVLLPILVATVFALIPHYLMSECFLRLVSVSVVFITIVLVGFWVWGMKAEERDKLKSIFYSFLMKLKLTKK